MGPSGDAHAGHEPSDLMAEAEYRQRHGHLEDESHDHGSARGTGTVDESGNLDASRNCKLGCNHLPQIDPGEPTDASGGGHASEDDEYTQQKRTGSERHQWDVVAVGVVDGRSRGAADGAMEVVGTVGWAEHHVETVCDLVAGTVRCDSCGNGQGSDAPCRHQPAGHGRHVWQRTAAAGGGHSCRLRRMTHPSPCTRVYGSWCNASG
jgi:hypothetical protein